MRSEARAADHQAQQRMPVALSPVDALVGIKVRYRLRRQIPVRLDFYTLALTLLAVLKKVGLRLSVDAENPVHTQSYCLE